MKLNTACMLVAVAGLLFHPIASADDEKDTKADYDSILKSLELSGELRLRFEGWKEMSPGKSLSQTLSRTRIGFSVEPQEGLTAFIQIQDSRIWGEEPSTLSSSDNLDLHQAYFEYKDINNSGFRIKAGRQELIYGDQRLIGPVGWSNVGRSFDALLVGFARDAVSIDGFIATTHEGFSAAEDAVFGGVYTTFQNKVFGVLDLYGLFKLDDRRIFTGELSPEPGDLRVYTFGARLAGSPQGSPISYGVEAAFQTGDFADDELEAYALHARAAWKAISKYNLVLSGEFNFASGDDDPADGMHGTFDNLFPTNHNKYGYIDFIGWRNLENYRAGLALEPAKGHILTADLHYFNLATAHDNAYRAGGAPLLIVPPDNEEDEIGSEVDLTWKFPVVKGLGMYTGYSRFFAGALFETVTGRERSDTDFFYLQSTVSF